MLKKLQKKSEGFTIIEVMIVLAIAGLILLIVFLAIPALQRNSRNTQRKSEAAAIASAYSEFVNNHGGKVPVAADLTAITNNAKLSFYSSANISFDALVDASTADPAAPDTDHVVIVTHAKCDAQIDYGTTQGTDASPTSSVRYSSRGGVVVYTVEGGSGNTTTCISAN
jgi:prepilin-type N-terminal cleavage/methylation domain-containing protein